MRGNRTQIAQRMDTAGSIPAYAGEPSPDELLLFLSQVYPRVCGGTGAVPPPSAQQRGLSPRMRGNHISKIARIYYCRSIPAYAGEPYHDTTFDFCYPVYPRVCGGTRLDDCHLAANLGLSPRMRGNHDRPGGVGVAYGSIPAYAGEPHIYRHASRHQLVYPRVCGGTLDDHYRCGKIHGLSPRMRGNLAGYVQRHWQPRSIPAYAGEPQECVGDRVGCRVYPRVCGGTLESTVTPGTHAGLSPRMRGNPALPAPVRAGRRSIPAYAGEPPPLPMTPCWPPVYPRVCGGTP